MELQLKIIGFLLLILASIHLFFPKYFQWKKELATLSLINRQMMYVHTFFVALVVFLLGLLSFLRSHELVHTTFGREIALGIGVFWLIRLIMQFTGYSAVLWRGKKFETTMHILFTLLWTYLSAVFLAIYFKF